MRIFAFSDTHGHHRKVKVDETCDVLVFAGDICGDHTNPICVEDFNDWLGTIKIPHKLVVAGNHDWPLFKDKRLITNGTYLEDSGVTINGVKFWGSPWQPEFCNWAFNLPRKGDTIRSKWSMIPEDTKVLVTHGPPYGILDFVDDDSVHVGCEELQKRILKLKDLKTHVFGHIHCGYGVIYGLGVTEYCNVSICDEGYRPVNKPYIIELINA